MRLQNKSSLFFLVFLIFVILYEVVQAGPYIAYSLKEAEKIVRKEPWRSGMAIGGITFPIGMVYDHERNDMIIIGQIREGEEAVTIDDLAVALQVILKFRRLPVVSIDKISDGDRAQKQRVIFSEGLKNTKFGKDLFEADVILKKLGLGKINAEIWGVRSYFDMKAEEWKKTGKEEPIAIRFWFTPFKKGSFVGNKQGVTIIKKVKLTIDIEILGTFNIKKDKKTIKDEIGERFAFDVSEHLEEIANYYPQLKRLDPLFRLTAIAKAIEESITKGIIPSDSVEFWLYNYKTKNIETPDEYPLIVNEYCFQERTMSLSGGIILNTLIQDLKDGIVTSLREIVLRSRPDGNPLLWRVPLEGWMGIETDEKQAFKKEAVEIKIPQSKDIGMTISIQFYGPGGRERKAPNVSMTTPKPQEASGFTFMDKFPSQKYSSNVGGVMLSGTGRISGGKAAKVDLTTGYFSLVVEGENAFLSPDLYRKFITALWSVYFSNSDPGISIDPIAPGLNKHLVRYIGKVINTDLGRVMREADYLMKKWAVGTERPVFPDFRNPDDISGRRGYIYAGAWSRFWFVPEDFSFKRAGDLLLYDKGRMRVKTEYMFKGLGPASDLANEEFAKWFTDNYEKIAEKYSVYKELFEYAKMVALSKYLKEQGIPLFWFLMANKDLVITEDSPGTVDALIKGSDYFRNIHIEGGVDLGVDLKKEGNYVYDREAIRAINEAISKFSPKSFSRTILSFDERGVKPISDSFSFNIGENQYTVLPQHSLTSGKDRRGIRYQTDIAVKGTGFQLTEETLFKIKEEIFYRETLQELNPILQSGNEKRLRDEFENISQKVRRRVGMYLQGLGKLKDKRFSSEEEFMQAVKGAIGDEMTERLKPIITRHSFFDINLEIVRYYKPEGRGVTQFGKGWYLLIPYRIRAEGTSEQQFLNVIIPEKMAVENLITGETEILTFSKDRYSIAGYVPENSSITQTIGLFIMTDGSFRLLDKLGNEFWFDQTGTLTDMIFSEHQRIHIDYLNNLKRDVIGQAPYKIRPVDQEKVKFLNVIVPKRMEVKDLINGKIEILTFNDKGKVVGYTSSNPNESRFEIIAIMSDASFRLIDKMGNEIVFDPTGEFEEIVLKERVVSSLSQGEQIVKFKYGLNSLGEMVVANIDLIERGKDKPLYTVAYVYDESGRLCGTKREEILFGELNKGSKIF